MFAAQEKANQLKELQNLKKSMTSTTPANSRWHQAWEMLSVVDIDKYIMTMPDRIAAVLASHGEQTRY
jgi:hypothetical protein